MVLEAGYPNTTGFRKVVKATILVKKKPGLSDADFISHYNKKHAEMAKGVLLKHGCITYSLVSTYTANYTHSNLANMSYNRRIISNATET
jgi:hypothetical protein